MPSVGEMVTAADGTKGEVSSINVLRQLVKVVVDNGDEKELREYSVDDLRFRPRRKKDVKLTDEELKELGELAEDGTPEEKPARRNRNRNRHNDNRGKEQRGDNE